MCRPMSVKPLVACFGEVLLRFSPRGTTPLREADALDAYVGGAEANVAVSLATLGIRSRMITTLPDNALADCARRALRADGVDLSGIAAREGRMGVYYLSPAAGPLGGSVLYDRQDSAFSLAETYDPAVLDGVRHLHLSGISLAVSEAAASATIALARAARDRGVTISFDGNFRPSLWEKRDGDPAEAIATLFGLADIVFGNHRDIAIALGNQNTLDARTAAEAAFNAFPSLSVLACTTRTIADDGGHHIAARIDTRERYAQSRERTLTGIVDRIGTGDAFSAGVLFSWLTEPADLEKAVETGMALCALAHYRSGDACRATHAELQAMLNGGGDVVR